MIEDLGGGALVPLAAFKGDPLVAESVAAGADVVCFSTDKILGGPQGGVLVGARKAIDTARRDPLARALRLGRLPLVALEATLASYLRGDAGDVPAVAMAQRPLGELRARAEAWQAALAARGCASRVVDVTSVTGGGTYAGEEVASVAIAIDGPSPDALLARLRAAETPIVARIEEGVVLFDARTVLPGEDDALVRGVASAALARDAEASHPLERGDPPG